MVALDSGSGACCSGCKSLSDYEVVSSMSDGQTSTACSAWRSDKQQCSCSVLTSSLKHLLICGLMRCAERMVMICPVLEMEFEIALKVSPVSQPREPNVVSGGIAPSRRLWHVAHIG